MFTLPLPSSGTILSVAIRLNGVGTRDLKVYREQARNYGLGADTLQQITGNTLSNGWVTLNSLTNDTIDSEYHYIFEMENTSVNPHYCYEAIVTYSTQEVTPITRL